jgi:hypothetical protein
VLRFFFKKKQDCESSKRTWFHWNQSSQIIVGESFLKKKLLGEISLPACSECASFYRWSVLNDHRRNELANFEAYSSVSERQSPRNRNM